MPASPVTLLHAEGGKAASQAACSPYGLICVVLAVVPALLLTVLLFGVWWKYCGRCHRQCPHSGSGNGQGDLLKPAGHPPGNESNPASKLVLVIHPGLQTQVGKPISDEVHHSPPPV